MNNNTKIVFCVPFINGIDSLLAVQKLKNLFCGVNSNAVIEFVLLLNYSMMIDESETLAGLDSAIKGMKEKVYAAHIKTKFTPGFENIIDYTEDGPNRDWFSILGSLDETSKITMGKFLKDYVDTVKAVY